VVTHAVQHARHERDPVARVMAHALETISDLVPAAFAAFFRLGPGPTAGHAVVASHRTDMLEAIAAGSWDTAAPALCSDPFAPYRGGAAARTVITTTELGGAVALSGTAVGRRLALLGARSAMAVYLHQRLRLVGAILLVRTDGEGDFKRADAARARWAHRLVELAFLTALQASGTPAGRSSLDGWGLTTRERQVAVLAARGTTNAEIARALVVSERTVKAHLTRVFAKVGVRSRTELAARVAGG
jgi:DNA-binding CsgD family transcriptional regulator